MDSKALGTHLRSLARESYEEMLDFATERISNAKDEKNARVVAEALVSEISSEVAAETAAETAAEAAAQIGVEMAALRKS